MSVASAAMTEAEWQRLTDEALDHYYYGRNAQAVTGAREALKAARGPGNFRNLFVHSPNGKKDGLQIIPVSEVAAKDEFANVSAQVLS